MNNSVFGKTLANIRNRVAIRLIISNKVAKIPHCRSHEEEKALL